MKVIDLLNKIAKGENVPKKIKFEETIYEYSETFGGIGYLNTDDDVHCDWLLNNLDLENPRKLNDEIEIIEEEKEIEEIIILTDDANMKYVANKEYRKLSYSQVDLLFANKFNEIIKEVNKLKKEGK